MQRNFDLLSRYSQHDKLAITLSSDKLPLVPKEVTQLFTEPQRINYYFLSYVHKGEAHYSIDAQDFAITDGQMTFAQPHQVCKPVLKSEGSEYFKIAFDETTLALMPQHFSFLVSSNASSIIRFDEFSQQRVKAVFEMFNHLLFRGNKAAGTDVILAYLNTLLTEFNSAYLKNNGDAVVAGSTRLSTYIAFKVIVETHLAEQQPVHTIAEKLAVTPGSLYNIVKEFAGVSPKEFITHRLMIEAQRKLSYSRTSVKELAYDLGFNDPDYFSRLFKKHTGQSISQYVESIKDLSGR